MKLDQDASGIFFAEVPADFLGGLSAGPSAKVVFLRRGRPHAHQVAWVERLLSGEIDDRQVVLAAAFMEWNRCAAERPALGLVALDVPAAVMGRLAITTIYVYRNLRETGMQYGLAGKWAAEPVHGFGVVVWGGTVKTLGRSGVAAGELG